MQHIRLDPRRLELLHKNDINELKQLVSDVQDTCDITTRLYRQTMNTLQLDHEHSCKRNLPCYILRIAKVCQDCL